LKAGLCLIPEGRGVFRALTVQENLVLATPPWLKSGDFRKAFDAFPLLESRLGQVAASLSGGEQQMLAMARAYLSSAPVILCDELSAGLAPILLDQLFDSIRYLASTGVTVVIVEQYVSRVLQLAHLVYILVRGEVTWEGQAAMVDRELLARSYLGGTHGDEA
jgi:branched-chain amino acid transport system ATP-binding protein